MNRIKVSSSNNKSFLKRFVIPALIGPGIFLLLFWTYYSSWYVDNRLLHYLLTDVVGALFGFFLLFNVLFIYPMLYFRGAPPVERITGAFLITFFWCIKEVYRMTEFYSLGKSLFFLLFPIQFNIILISFGFMGLCEMVCRFIEKKRREMDLKVITPLPLSILIILIAVTIFSLHDGGVTYFFYTTIYLSIFLCKI